MINLKSKRSRPTILWSVVALLMVAGVISLVYSFVSGRDDTTENLSDIDAIYTNAMATLDAQQLTLQVSAGTATLTPAALISPTATFTPSGGLPALLSTSTSAAASTCDSSIYLADVTIPDGATVTPGQTFTKTWKVSNTGTCTWSATYQIVLISGDGMSGKATQIGKTVKPGESAEISVSLTAPSTTGTIKGTWRLSNDKSQPFGTLLTVEIKVSGAAYPNP